MMATMFDEAEGGTCRPVGAIVWEHAVRKTLSGRANSLFGGHAVALQDDPRFTGDIDFFVGITPLNAQRLLAAFADFGSAMSLSPDSWDARRIRSISSRPHVARH